MAIARLIAKSVANTAAAVSEISSVMVSAGWVVVDDQYSGSEYIWHRNTGSEDGTELEAYISLDSSITADRLHFMIATHWDAATHTGTHVAYYSSFGYVHVDDDNPFTIWVFASKDQVSITTKISTSYYYMTFGKMERYWDKPLGTLQSGVTAGSSVVLQLASGQTEGFEVGESYTICENSTNAQEVPTVTAISTVDNQITVDSLSQNWGSGSKIGFIPMPYYFNGYMINGMSYGCMVEPAYTTKTTRNQDCINGGNYMIPNTIHDPDALTGFYILAPMHWYGGASDRMYGFNGDYIAYWRANTTNTFEDTIEVGRLDTGTSTSSGFAGTLVDTSKSWTPDDYIDKAVIITSGTGQGQIAKIVGNSSDTLSLDINWVSAISTDSTYTICDEAWMGFMSSSYGYAFRAV